MPMHDPELALITLAEASGHWNGRVSAKCLWRWCRDGILCGGRPVRLRTVRVGGRHMTTVAWVVSFLEEIGDFDARVLEGRSRRSPLRHRRLSLSKRSRTDRPAVERAAPGPRESSWIQLTDVWRLSDPVKRTFLADFPALTRGAAVGA